ncbi:MAG: type III-B CRISPR module RAMP protein Cmr4, partial [Dolichospermum sp.]
MPDFRVGYMYSLAPIHCGGEGDLGNILEIAREVHTNFPYVPGSSLRGSLRDAVEILDKIAGTNLFGKELDKQGQMGVHQVWFGDARLLWIPMRTMSSNNRDVFTWVSCHSLIRDHALVSRQKTAKFPKFPNHAVGSRAGVYSVADAQIQVSLLSDEQKQATSLTGWPDSLKDAVKPTWDNNLIVLPDADFQVLMEHSLWTQVRNKIQDKEGVNPEGSAEIFWTDICIPRDTIFYYPWGYSLPKDNSITEKEHNLLISVLQELFQVGGQANVGRGWVQGWTNNLTAPIKNTVT